MENWMSKLPDNKLLLLTNIPGSHDAAAYNMHFFGSVFAKCQDLNIMEQLKAGTRLLDIRIAKRSRPWLSCRLNQLFLDDNDLICVHGICDCYHINKEGVKINLTYKDVLMDMRKFLEENPSETIVLTIEPWRGDFYTILERAMEIYDNIVGDISIKFDKNLTIGDARGKIIQVDYQTGELNSEGKPIYHGGFDGGTNIGEIHNKFVPKGNFAAFQADGRLKVEEIKEFLRIHDITIEEAEEDWKTINNNKYPIKYSISCTGEHKTILPFPKAQANIVKPFILNYNLKKGNYYGFLYMDFVDKYIAKKLIDTNFK